MAEHLPECFMSDLRWEQTVAICICDRLRACEERIKTHEGCADAERAEGYSQGREDAAAAVAALPVAHYESGIALVQASRAIAAARGAS